MNHKIFFLLIGIILISCGQSSQVPKTAKLTMRPILNQMDDPYDPVLLKEALIKSIDKDSLAKEDSAFIKSNPAAWFPSHIDFPVEKDDSVFVDVYDVKGNIIDQLYSGFLKQGHYLITPVVSYSPGVYFIKYKIGSILFVKKYIVTK
jgi:hypothetical protein